MFGKLIVKLSLLIAYYSVPRDLLRVNYIIMFLLHCVVLQTTTATSALPPGTIRRNGRHILDPPDLHPVPRQRPQGALSPRSRTAALVPPRPANLDVKRGDSQFLATGRHVLSGEHGGVRRGFVPIGLDFHPSRDADERLASGEIGDVYEGVVEGGE